MKDEREKNVEELAEALESRISRKEEAADDGVEELNLSDAREKWGSKDEIFPEGEDFPEDEWEDEETAPMKPWMTAAVLAGLIVLAAIICAILWHFTHLEKDSGGGNAQSSSIVYGENMPSDSSEPFATAPTPEAASAPEVTTAPTAAPPATPTPDMSTSAPAVSQTTASSDSAPVQEPISGTTAMEFTQSIADVTPKDVINLRSEPSTLNADNIVAQAKNGEILSRTGVNGDTGWTRIEYNGEVLYAVSQYLTTDLTYKTPVQTTNPNRVNTLDGRIIIFVDCSDNITPKEYVNLRTEPSTSEGEATVRCQISNGEVVHRTGYSPDAGWSRVEYNGESLYVVSSYMYTVE